jgi:peptidoglycan/LPS O-acetylase OafA/YrhL
MKLASIQYLRGVAAIGVVLSHAAASLIDREHALIAFEFGSYGVDLFFVISGFIMFYTTADDTMKPSQFFQRRLIRILPLYYLLTTVAFALAVAIPGAVNTLTSKPVDYLLSLLFVPFFNEKSHAIQPVLGMGWTLNYEMFFYLVFGVALVVSRGARMLGCLAIFAALAVGGTFLSTTNPILLVYTNPITLEFVLGMAIGYAVVVHAAQLPRILLGLAAASIVIVGLHVGAFAPGAWSGAMPRFLVAGVPCAAIVGGAVWVERSLPWRDVPALLLVGDASYSLYLSHGLVLGVVRRFWARLFDVSQLGTHVAFMWFGTAIAMAASFAIYLLAERPMTRWLTARFRRAQAPGLAPVPAPPRVPA